MLVKKGTAAVTVLCRNSSLICCAIVDGFQPVPEMHVWLGSGVSAPGTWAPQLLLLQTSLPYSLTPSTLSTGIAVERGAGWDWHVWDAGMGRQSKKRKGNEGKEYSLPKSGISSYLVCLTVIRQDHSFSCRRHLFEC